MKFLTHNGLMYFWSKIKEELDYLKNSVSNGKKLVANAITDKGIPTEEDATFATMAENISQIQSGGGDYVQLIGNSYRLDTVLSLSPENNVKLFYAKLPYYSMTEGQKYTTDIECASSNAKIILIEETVGIDGFKPLFAKVEFKYQPDVNIGWSSEYTMTCSPYETTGLIICKQNYYQEPRSSHYYGSIRNETNNMQVGTFAYYEGKIHIRIPFAIDTVKGNIKSVNWEVVGTME